MSCYRVGDSAPISDGVYLGYDGVVVVKDGKLMMVEPVVHSSWGRELKPIDLINSYNPASSIVESISDEHNKKCKNHCPNCGAPSNKIEWGGFESDDPPYQKAVCSECGCVFNEIYEYSYTEVSQEEG
jgi:hypothetical protein